MYTRAQLVNAVLEKLAPYGISKVCTDTINKSGMPTNNAEFQAWVEAMVFDTLYWENKD